MYARPTAVTAVRNGDEIAVAALSGATSITVDDVADFGEGPGWLRLNGTVYQYLTADDDTGVITLATGLSAAAAEGDAVELWDPTANGGAGEVSVDYEADLSPDDDIPGDPLQATIDHSMVPLLRTSVRASGSEAAQLAWDGDDLRVTRIHGKKAAVGGEYVRTPLWKGFLSADQAWADNSWNTVLFDTWTIYDMPYDFATGKVTIPANRFYMVSAGAGFVGNINGARGVRLMLDSVTFGAGIILRQIRYPVDGGAIHLEAHRMHHMGPGDKVYVQAYQNSGVSLNLLGAYTNFDVIGTGPPA